MTLLFVDGFDVGDETVKWFVPGDVPLVSAVTPFGSGRSCRTVDTSINFLMMKSVTPSATVILGANFRWDGPDVLVVQALRVFHLWSDSGTTMHLTVAVSTIGTVQLWLGDIGGALIASGPAVQITPNVWFYIEIKASIADSGGTVVVRVNETEIINFTGDTRNGGTSTSIDVVGFGAQASDANWDDFYAANTGGSVNNDFFGIGRVQTLLPSAAGTDTVLTPVPGAPNYDNVNDVPWSSTDYNYSDTAGDRDLYQLDDLASSSVSVRGVQTVLIADSDDTTSSVKAVLRSAGTDYSDPTVVLNAAPSVVSLALRENDPATSAAWTVSAVNALQAGMEIVS